MADRDPEAQLSMSPRSEGLVVRLSTSQMIAIMLAFASTLGGVVLTTQQLRFEVNRFSDEIVDLTAALDKHTDTADTKLTELERRVARDILPEANRRLTVIETWRNNIEIRLGKLEGQ